MDRQTVLFTYIYSQVTQKTRAPKEPQVPIHEGQEDLGATLFGVLSGQVVHRPGQGIGRSAQEEVPQSVGSEPL